MLLLQCCVLHGYCYKGPQNVPPERWMFLLLCTCRYPGGGSHGLRPGGDTAPRPQRGHQLRRQLCTPRTTSAPAPPPPPSHRPSARGAGLRAETGTPPLRSPRAPKRETLRRLGGPPGVARRPRDAGTRPRLSPRSCRRSPGETAPTRAGPLPPAPARRRLRRRGRAASPAGRRKAVGDVGAFSLDAPGPGRRRRRPRARRRGNARCSPAPLPRPSGQRRGGLLTDPARWRPGAGGIDITY